MLMLNKQVELPSILPWLHLNVACSRFGMDFAETRKVQ